MLNRYIQQKLSNRNKINKLHAAVRDGEIKQILMVRTQKVGDMLTFLPTILEVNKIFPQASISLLCRKEALEVAQRIPFVNIILTDDLESGKIKAGNKYDLLITSASDAGKVKLKKQLNIRYAIGAVPESLKGICLKHRLQYSYFTGAASYSAHDHEVDRNLSILDLLGREEHDRAGKGLWIKEEEQRSVAAMLAGAKSPVVAISPTGSRPNQNWSPAFFASLCDRIVRELGGTPVLVGKGHLAKKQADDILAKIHEPAISIVDQTSLGELSALIEQADLLISVDTGTAHLASYLNRPLIVIFGPGNLMQWGPWHKDTFMGKVLSASCKCKRPLPQCLEKTHCLDSITPDNIFNTARELLTITAKTRTGT